MVADSIRAGEGLCSRVVLGLGNPGERYRASRHNVGFMVLDALAARLGVGLERELCASRIATRGELVLAAPQTFMNRSGYAARCLLETLAVPPTALLVVYDDLHLPLGRLRLRPGGGPGGHRGLESILQQLGSDEVPRLRLGIGTGAPRPPQGDELVDFVLAPFAAEEASTAAAMIEAAARACINWLEQPIDAAMAEVNRPPRDEVSSRSADANSQPVGPAEG